MNFIKTSVYLLLFFTFIPLNLLNSKDITFNGLNKLNIKDISTLTSIDINKNFYSKEEVNQIVKDLYLSDQIFNISLSESSNSYILNIEEALIIENIYINGNIYIKDKDLIGLLELKKNQFINKSLIDRDIKTIKNIYLSRGFEDISVNISFEKYSKSRLNIIFKINEGSQYKIKNINFIGNVTYNNKFLLSIITSKKIKFYNIFSNESNLNKAIFENDRSLINNFYKKNGFQNVNVSYILQKSFFNIYNLTFYIEENERSKISSIDFQISDVLKENLNFISISKEFQKSISKNDNYFDYDLINEFVNSTNNLIKNINLNKELIYNFNTGQEDVKLEFIEIANKPITIDDISIYGNSITKNNVLLSKIDLNPGDIYSEYKVNKSREKLELLKYVNKANVITTNKNDSIDLVYEIDENKKTGNFGFGVAFNGDTGGGFILNLKDSNVFGTGNEIESDFNLNSEQISFDFAFIHNPLNNSNYSNKYSIRNKEIDYQSSFGYKMKERSFSYDVLFDYSKSLSLSVGYSISNQIGHSGINSSDIEVTNNIGNFTDSIFNLSLVDDKTNDIFYPNQGVKQTFSIQYSPNEISDNSYIKATYSNDLYFNLKNSDNYFFLMNNLGFVESLNNKRLKTINSFSLGGLNFKGFDYRGVGPKNTNGIYLGGNKILTSTFGYGTSFLFDKKDNMYLKYFYTLGSLWDNDYSTNKFKIRSSAGISFDILSPIGPISFIYAVPLNKEAGDTLRKFNFSIGTAF